MCRRNWLYVSQLNAKASDLNQIVFSADELEIAVVQKTREVAGFENRIRGVIAERIGDEDLSGRFGIVEIAERKYGERK